MNRREARGGPGKPAVSDGIQAPLVLAIFGPTGSGKSPVAEALRDRTGAEVISADSMQVYRGVPILTNQPSGATRLVAIWDLEHEGSVGEFATLAHAEVDRALADGRTPVLAGGTGLYLRSALGDLALPPAAPPSSRARWERLYDSRGAAHAHAMLSSLDPGAAAMVHRNDRRRIVRGLELAEAGLSLRPPADRLWSEETRHPTLIFGLDVPPEALRERIVSRTRLMVERGGVEEARRAAVGPISATARELIGLREFTQLPVGAAMAAIDVRTMRYAAYQRKWMRRIPGIITVQANRPVGVIADEILEMARARERLPARRAG